MPSTGRPAADTGSGRCLAASPGPGTFAEPDAPAEAAEGWAQVWPLLVQLQQRLQASVTAAGRSAALPGPRSCYAKATPIWMEMVMGWRVSP